MQQLIIINAYILLITISSIISFGKHGKVLEINISKSVVFIPPYDVLTPS